MANVFSNANDNVYNSLQQNNNQQNNQSDQHTRIYKYSDSTIVLDEMSMPILQGTSNSSVNDVSSNNTDQDSNNINGKTGTTAGNKSPDQVLSIGTSYPLIRINDHYYTHTDIKKLVISSVDFVPTLELELSVFHNDILKENQIKDGDICSVFINPGHGMVKSYRADYVIMHTYMLNQSQLTYNKYVTIIVQAELYVPNLYNDSITFSYAGTSRDALIDMSKRLGLGFFFCDPENTKDSQIWYCTTDGESKNGGDSAPLAYLKNVSKHAYKNFQSFYDCWIDVRYGLTFVNINKMLGEDGLDEKVDIAFYNNAMTTSRGMYASNAYLTDEELKNNPKPQVKILTNINNDLDAATAFFVKSWKEENRGGDVTKELGLNTINYYDIKNAGLSNDQTAVEFNFSIPINKTKLENGFYVLNGPGTNTTYKQADNGSYVEQRKVIQGGKISDTMSDGDGEKAAQQQSNMLASGNTNKFFETGEGHNLLNNKWLEKKMIKVVLNGCNMQIMRGEKIPMLLKDNEFKSNFMGVNQQNYISKQVFEMCSGWFIIKDLQWVYDVKNAKAGTLWETHLTLTRREWPIIGYIKEEAAQEFKNENDLKNGSTKDAVYDSSANSQQNSSTAANSSTAENNEQKPNKEITTNGLTQNIIEIYNDIQNAVNADGGGIKLISGRRWAADEDGNRVEGEPKVMDGNLYKFINALGDVVWYTSKTSRHLYGEAIDIINKQGYSFDKILQIIIGDPDILGKMIQYGVYCAIETTRDDTGNTVKHYHIGTVDTSDSVSIKGQQTWWKNIIQIRQQSTVKMRNGKTINLNDYLSYNNNKG